MSTTGIDSWAVDLANIGAIYPFQGWETPMVIVGVVLWLLWHVWQIRSENQTYEEESQRLRDPAVLERAMRDGRLD